MNRALGAIISSAFRGSIGRVIGAALPALSAKLYVQHLRGLGVLILGEPAFISRDAYFDSHDYSKISLGDSVVISREVLLLTHDFSVARGLQAIGGRNWTGADTPHTLKPIHIGDNCFIGARATILPGTTIGDNCIVGACAVVKGSIPADSIVVGNPAAVIADTLDWASERQRLHDYLP